jgi:biopolymer transport protein ExbD
LIDVMLVLLIMFIITIPIQSHSVPIDLPVGEPEVTIEKERNKLIVDRAGGLYWNGSALTTEALAATLQRVGAMPNQPELQLEPHAEARYERVDEVLALIKASEHRCNGDGRQRALRPLLTWTGGLCSRAETVCPIGTGDREPQLPLSSTCRLGRYIAGAVTCAIAASSSWLARTAASRCRNREE